MVGRISQDEQRGLAVSQHLFNTNEIDCVCVLYWVCDDDDDDAGGGGELKNMG